MRRFTRLTNGFSKKAENHAHAVALYFLHYNFARIHKTLRVTPAMQAGLADHVWSIEEIVNLLGVGAARTVLALGSLSGLRHFLLPAAVRRSVFCNDRDRRGLCVEIQ